MSENSSNITLSYSPGDFFYLSAGSDMPNSDFCKARQSDPYDCIGFTNSTKKMCYQQELCKNKDIVETVIQKRDSHAQSDVKLDDTYSQYMNEYMKTINLSVGIILAVVFVIYNK